MIFGTFSVPAASPTISAPDDVGMSLGGTDMKHLAIAALSFTMASGAMADSFSATVAAGHPPVFRWVKMIEKSGYSEVFTADEMGNDVYYDGIKNSLEQKMRG